MSVRWEKTDRRAYDLHAGSKSFARKVEQAREIFRRGAERGRVVVSTSWGKDSVAMCAIACDVFDRPTLLHLASPYALPGYDETIAHFSERCDVVTLEASRSLAEYVKWCREIGLPHERSQSTQSKVVSEIKRDRGTEWCRDHGYGVQALGMRIAEKGPRAKLLRAKGPIYTLKDGTVKVNPLAYWSSADVWALIYSRGLPYNRRIYDAETGGETRETIRNTGWLSTDGAEHGRIAWLRRHFPEQHAVLLREFPQVKLLG